MSNLLSQASLVMIPSGYKEDVVYSAIPTNGNGDLSFTRASNGTRVNSAGLVEVVAWNLQTYSEDFTNGKYTLAAASITSNATNAPNGTATADKLVENTANDQHYIFFTSQQTAYNETRISVYAKAGGRTNLLMWESAITNAQSLFNLSTGVVASSSSGNAANLSTTVGQIEDAGNGWYRCSFNYSTSSGGGTIRLQLYTTTTSYTGDGTSGIFIWGLQENIGSTAKPYFPTTDRLNVPRLTYQNGGGGCPSLLLEKQSTNLVTYSEDLTNADWLKQQSTISANATTSPDGTQNADKLIINNGISGGYVYQLKSTSSGTVYTGSFYVKAGGVGYTKFWTNISGSYEDAVINLSTGAITNNNFAITPTVESVGNGWYRVVYTTTSGGGQVVVYVDGGSTSTGGSFTGNGTDGIFLWGAQLEASSYPTSYIPTTSSSATRVADACFKTGISSLIGQTEGTMYGNFYVQSSAESQSIWLRKASGGLYGDFLFMLTNNAQQPRVQVVVGGVAQFDYTGSSISEGWHKFALAYKQNNFAFYIDGVQIATQGSGTVPTCDEMYLGYYVDGGTRQTSQKEAILFPTRLTNAELASLTTL